jgi:hypothetical protein
MGEKKDILKINKEGEKIISLIIIPEKEDTFWRDFQMNWLEGWARIFTSEEKKELIFLSLASRLAPEQRHFSVKKDFSLINELLTKRDFHFKRDGLLPTKIKIIF